MLVLSLNVGESLYCLLPDGRAVRICLCEVKHFGCCKIGVEAPRDIRVSRESILTPEEREQAAKCRDVRTDPAHGSHGGRHEAQHGDMGE